MPQVGPWSFPELHVADGASSAGILCPQRVKEHTLLRTNVPYCFAAPRMNA